MKFSNGSSVIGKITFPLTIKQLNGIVKKNFKHFLRFQEGGVHEAPVSQLALPQLHPHDPKHEEHEKRQHQHITQHREGVQQ